MYAISLGTLDWSGKQGVILGFFDSKKAVHVDYFVHPGLSNGNTCVCPDRQKKVALDELDPPKQLPARHNSTGHGAGERSRKNQEL